MPDGLYAVLIPIGVFISLVVLYYVVKGAVRNGVREAYSHILYERSMNNSHAK